MMVFLVGGVIMEERYKLIVEGLDCASCALKIEDSVKAIDGVIDASVNFSNKTMIVKSNRDSDTIIKRIREAVSKIEPHVIVLERSENRRWDNGIIRDKLQKDIVRLLLGVVPFILALFIKSNSWIKLTLFFLSYIIIGIDVLKKAIYNISRGQIFDENFLMGIATLGAFIIGQYPEGVAVLLFYEIGEFFQDMAVHRSRKSIAGLMDVRPDYANLKKGDEIIKVSPIEINPGEIIVIRPGEKVPLDGYILEGQSSMDTSALTGESLPRNVKVGDEVLAGFINSGGLIQVQVSKPFGQSTVSKILDLVENAGNKKASTENFITRFARYYTPVVVFSALAIAILPPLILVGESFSDWIYRALVFLVISCPCALVISIPLGFFGGIGGASRHGILVKGGNYLEAMTEIDTVVFDKTGTLTKGIFSVTEINPIYNMGKDELLFYGAIAESHSTHPIAASILKAYGSDVDKSQIKSYREIAGHGLNYKVELDAIVSAPSLPDSTERITITLTPPYNFAPFTLLQPASSETEFQGNSTKVSFKIQPDSKVIINEEDLSSSVSEDGRFEKEFELQPQQEELVLDIRVSTPGYLDNIQQIILRKTTMDVPLEIKGTSPISSEESWVKVEGITHPEATLDADREIFEEPQIDRETGDFTVYIKAERPGYTPCTLLAKLDGKESSLEIILDRKTNVDTYTSTAWKPNYDELQQNTELSNGRHFVFTGEIKDIIETGDKNVFTISLSEQSASEQLFYVEYWGSFDYSPGDRLKVFGNRWGNKDDIPRFLAKYIYD
jgi:copper chaperone CopZ